MDSREEFLTRLTTVIVTAPLRVMLRKKLGIGYLQQNETGDYAAKSWRQTLPIVFGLLIFVLILSPVLSAPITTGPADVSDEYNERVTRHSIELNPEDVFDDDFECELPDCTDEDYDIELYLHATPVTFPYGTGPMECCNKDDFYTEKPDVPLVGNFCMITSNGTCGSRHLLAVREGGKKVCGKLDQPWAAQLDKETPCVKMPDRFHWENK